LGAGNEVGKKMRSKKRRKGKEGKGKKRFGAT